MISHHDCLPDCMMPDGGDCCLAYQNRMVEIEQLERERDEAVAEYNDAIKECQKANTAWMKHGKENIKLRKAIEDALDKCKPEYPQPFSNLGEIANILRKALEVTK